MLFAVAPAAHAQDVNPRAYILAPVGVTAIALNYSISTGDVLVDRALPVEDVSGDIHTLGLALSQTFGLTRRLVRVDLAVPFVSGEWSGAIAGDRASTSKTGLADPALRLAVPLWGAPALQATELTSYAPRTIVAMTLRLGIPLGQYERDDVINLGSNRWWIGPQLGLSYFMGRLLLEGYIGVRFFTPNDEYLGSKELTQRPLYTVQLHAGYLFQRGLWVAASTRQSLGGATSIDGGEHVNPETNNRVGVTVAVPIGGSFALRVAATTGVVATIGNDYTTFAVALSTSF